MRLLKKTKPIPPDPFPQRHGWLVRYGVGLLAVAVAFGIRFALDPLLGNYAPFILFIPAIIIAAWIGGLRPALVASLATLILADQFFIMPQTRWPPDTREVVAAGTYVFAALVVAGLMRALQRERAQVIHHAQQLEKEVEQRKRAEITLRESEERLRAILENSPAMIFLKDTEGRYLVSNREFEAITHRPAADTVGKTDEDLFPESQAASFRSNDKRVLKYGVPMQFEEIALHDDGPHTSIVHKFPLRDASGKIYAIGGVVTDITERKRMEDALKFSEQKYRSLYTNTPVMLHSIDPDGRLISVSNFWLNSLGYKEEEVLGRRSSEFLTPESQKYAVETVLPAYFRSGICMNVPYQMVKKNGEIIDILLSAIAEKDDKGNVLRSLAVLVDVTTQKRTEDALRASETRLRVLAETAVDAIISADHAGNIIQFNRAAERIFGYTSEEILGKPITVLMPQTVREKYQSGFARYMADTDNKLVGMTTELVGLRKNGMEFPVEISLSTWKTAEGKFFTGILRDITERKQAENALRQSEELLRMTTEGANIGVWSWDAVNDILECPKTERHFGEAEPMRLNTFLQHVHPNDRQWVNEEIQSCLRDGHEFDVQYRTLDRDGTVRWLHSKGATALANGRVVRISGISMDITSHKQAQEALRQSEEMLRITTEGAGVGLWDWNVTNNVLTWNPVEYEQFALHQDAPLHLQTFLEHVHPNDRASVEKLMETSLREHSELNMEYRVVWPDGTVRWRYCKGRPSYAENQPVRMSGISLDITERKHADEALRRQAEMLDFAQVLAFDLEDTILFWNRGAEKLYGWSEQEAVGKNGNELLHTEFPQPVEEIKRKLFERGFWEGELVHFRKDGEQICVASHWALFKDKNNRPVAILESNNNISKLKKAESALQEARDALAKHAENLEQCVERRTAELQRSLKDMESFCYTIAHDLRAPLRAMSGFTYSLAEDFAPQLGPIGRDYCARINAASSRMSQLISDLLLYGRLSHSETPSQSVDLHAEIEKVLTRAAPQIEERQAEIKVDKPLFHVCGDAPVLDQIIENLITNAVKFVPPERKPRVHIYAEHRQNNVRLCVEDNGIGILPEHWQKIFRPFERLHTNAYPGTGIGLAIVQRGIEKMGGHVGVESVPEQGSRFWVELPERCERA